MPRRDYTEEVVTHRRDQRPSPRAWSGWLERLTPPAMDGLSVSAASPTRRHEFEDSLILRTKFPVTENTVQSRYLPE
jgi:hypothetical protein